MGDETASAAFAVLADGLGDAFLPRADDVARIVDILVLLEDFADDAGPVLLALGVDVDLAGSAIDGLAELIVRDAAAAVENERDLHEVVDFLHLVEAELRFAMIRAMDRAEGRSEAIDMGFLHELDAFARNGIHAFGNDFVFLAADLAEFRLDAHAARMGIVDYLLDEGDVLFERELAAVDHDRAIAGIDGGLAPLEAGAVVNVDGHRDRDVVVMHVGEDHVDDDVVAAHVSGRAFADAEDDRGLEFLASVEDGAHPFEVVDVELSDCVVSLLGLLEHFGHAHVVRKIVLIFHACPPNM